MYTKIVTKQMSCSMYEKGEFGNKLRTWVDFESLQADPYTGTVTVRSATTPGWKAIYEVPQGRSLELISEEGLRYNESAPDDQLVIQGEFVADKDHGYILSYSTDKIKMRMAMESPKELLGREALYMVQRHLSLESMRNMRRLLATYPNAVIEFSTYDHFLGDTPENNTVFWEVRNY